MENFTKVEVLGSGSFGCAWLVKSKKNEDCVIKEISIPKMKLKDKEAAINEVKILATLKHKNIIRYKEAFINDKKLCICMEYANDGDLATKIKEQNGKLFLELEIIDWFVQILIAVKYIHSLHILHRDLKSQNIFLMKSGLVKIGDFGISRYLDGDLQQALTAIGTPYYLSPEICQQKPYNSKSDMWSLGVLLYELATLRHPFVADDFSSLIVKIIKGCYQAISNCYGPLLQDLVLVLLQTEPDDRPSASQLLKVPSLQPHIKSYLMKVKHREDPVIFDSGISLSGDEAKKVGKRRCSYGMDSVKSIESTDCCDQNDDGKNEKATANDFSDDKNPTKPAKERQLRTDVIRKTAKRLSSDNGKITREQGNKTPSGRKSLKINFIERNRNMVGYSPNRDNKVGRHRRIQSTPEQNQNGTQTPTRKTYHFRSRTKSSDAKVTLLAARVKQLSTKEKDDAGDVNPSNSNDVKGQTKVSVDPDIEFPNVRKRAASLMSLAAGKNDVPSKLTKRSVSCEDKCEMLNSVAAHKTVAKNRKSIEGKHPRQSLRPKRLQLGNVEPTTSTSRSKQGTLKHSSKDEEKNESNQKKSSLSRRSSVGLPEGISISEKVKSRIAGRIRSASATCERNLKNEKADVESDKNDDDVKTTENIARDDSDQKLVLKKPDISELPKPPMHSTLKDDTRCDVVAMVNIPETSADSDSSQLHRPSAKTTTTRKIPTTKNSSTYNVTKTLKHVYPPTTQLQSEIRKIIGVRKFHVAVDMARQVKLSKRDYDVIKALSEMLGEQHRGYLVDILDLVEREGRW